MQPVNTYTTARIQHTYKQNTHTQAHTQPNHIYGGTNTQFSYAHIHTQSYSLHISTHIHNGGTGIHSITSIQIHKWMQHTVKFATTLFPHSLCLKPLLPKPLHPTRQAITSHSATLYHCAYLINRTLNGPIYVVELERFLFFQTMSWNWNPYGYHWNNKRALSSTPKKSPKISPESSGVTGVEMREKTKTEL